MLRLSLVVETSVPDLLPIRTPPPFSIICLITYPIILKMQMILNYTEFVFDKFSEESCNSRKSTYFCFIPWRFISVYPFSLLIAWLNSVARDNVTQKLTFVFIKTHLDGPRARPANLTAYRN